MTFPFELSRRGWVYVLGGLIVLLSLVTLIGERGAIHLWRLRGEKVFLDEQNYRLQKENEELRQRASRMRHDNHYLEKMAREELNMARPGEVIYRFRNAKPDNAKSDTLSAAPIDSRRSAAQK